MADEALPSDREIALTPSVPAPRSPSEITAGSTAALAQGNAGPVSGPGRPGYSVSRLSAASGPQQDSRCRPA